MCKQFHQICHSDLGVNIFAWNMHSGIIMFLFSVVNLTVFSGVAFSVLGGLLKR